MVYNTVIKLCTKKFYIHSILYVYGKIYIVMDEKINLRNSHKFV